MARFDGIPVEKTGNRFGGEPIAAKPPVSQPSEPFDFSAIETIKNIPGSAGQFAKDLITPIIHPIDTAESLYNLARGAAEKLIPNEIDGVDFGPQQHEAYVDALGRFFVDRYGSVENFKKTVQNDPVGVLTDASMLLTGGGAALKTGKISKAGKVMNTTGKAMEPVNIVWNTAKYTGGKMIPKKVPRKLYQSAAKFRPSLSEKKRASMTETALREQIMPTSKGVAKINMTLRKLGDELDTLIDTATKEGKLIPRQAIYKHLKKLRRELGGAKLEGGKDLKRINKVVKEFEDHMDNLNKDYVTPSELQAFKKDAYTRINFDLKQGKAQYATNEAREAIARGAKELIEESAPDVIPINRRMGDLLELGPELERSASRIENLNLVGLSTPLNIGVGGIIGPDELGALLGTGVSILEMPKPKSGIALMLERGRRMRMADMLNNKTAGALTRGSMVQSGRLQQGYEDDPVLNAYRYQ